MKELQTPLVRAVADRNRWRKTAIARKRTANRVGRTLELMADFDKHTWTPDALRKLAKSLRES